MEREKRGDRPFEFGQRYLLDEEAVWDYNAWDHVEWGEEQRIEAEEKLAAQKEHPVTPHDRERYMSNPARFWDIFYRNNRANFFKDRKWLRIEFPSLYEATRPDGGPVNICEIGCGAGNTMFPVLEANENPHLKVTGLDFSPRAVQLVREHAAFNPEHAHAAVWDLANPDGNLPEGVEPHSQDIVVLIFVLSALAPEQWTQAVANIRKLARPGAQVLFRDYGRYDLAQVRFKKGRLLGENFYIRGDGTRVYFFTEDEIRQIFEGFDDFKIATDRRLIVNRLRRLKMYRIWLQSQFRVPRSVDN